METRKTCCRACGENKGHSFAQCKNVGAMKEIIASQDNETKSFQEQMSAMKADVARIPQLEGAYHLSNRIIHALLDLAEIHRRLAPKGNPS